MTTSFSSDHVLPAEYASLSPVEIDARIIAAKQALGNKTVVLAHFYQRDAIVKHADFVGDSFQLSRTATALPDAQAIVFCGVHFMTETADILSGQAQEVILPNLSAGCSMADMASVGQVEAAWKELTGLFGDGAETAGRAPLVPVTYINSSAAIKDFCGRHGGIVCTSSNARAVLEWAFERGERVVFFPDQHLGRNTAKAMGIALDDMVIWVSRAPLGGNGEAALREAKVILWDGYCSVHQRFNVEQIARARAQHPQVRVIVHPECSMEVVDAADVSGSTDLISKTIQGAEAGGVFAVGTEINLVRRLAEQNPQHTVFSLDPVFSPCPTMYRVQPAHLAWVLERLMEGEAVNRIRVPGAIATGARVALERMLAAQP
ncbi:MAG: quinolinate synthase NadA [Xanthomonadaceae bacterium]|jgi:quinolinate synthase|nr:quinolinate synthase NadA [Xanthomonadaceae bacterium]